MKWSLLLSVFLAVQLTLVICSSVKRNKNNKDEDKNNSINYYYKELVHSPGSLITSMLHDATLPVFLVMGAASLSSLLTNVSFFFYYFDDFLILNSFHLK